jgi:hypothetical protein
MSAAQPFVRLYHYTAGSNLRGVAKHGLTVGDVPTDISRFGGLIGVWFTTSLDPAGHGLEAMGRSDKQRFRLTVDLPADTRLKRWADWKHDHVKPDTINILERAAAHNGTRAAETWWIYFGHVKSEWIFDVVDMQTGQAVADWKTCWPASQSRPGIPYWRREAWQTKTLKKIARAMRPAA